MGEMVKRLARAICASYGDDYDDQPADLAALEALRRQENGSHYDGVHPHDPGLPTQADWDECARAAFMALDDPNEAMLHGARDWSYVEYGKPIGKDAALGCWHSMVEAALSEG